MHDVLINAEDEHVVVDFNATWSPQLRMKTGVKIILLRANGKQTRYYLPLRDADFNGR
jgi:hypothetical protein